MTMIAGFRQAWQENVERVRTSLDHEPAPEPAPALAAAEAPATATGADRDEEQVTVDHLRELQQVAEQMSQEVGDAMCRLMGQPTVAWQEQLEDDSGVGVAEHVPLAAAAGGLQAAMRERPHAGMLHADWAMSGLEEEPRFDSEEDARQARP